MEHFYRNVDINLYDAVKKVAINDKTMNSYVDSVNGVSNELLSIKIEPKNKSYSVIDHKEVEDKVAFSYSSTYNHSLFLKISILFQYFIANSLAMRCGNKNDFKKFKSSEEVAYSLTLARFFSMHRLYDDFVVADRVLDLCRKMIKDVGYIVNQVVDNSDKNKNILINRGYSKENLTIDIVGNIVWKQATVDQLSNSLKRLKHFNTDLISSLTGNTTYDLEVEYMVSNHLHLFKLVRNLLNKDINIMYIETSDNKITNFKQKYTNEFSDAMKKIISSGGTVKRSYNSTSVDDLIVDITGNVSSALGRLFYRSRVSSKYNTTVEIEDKVYNVNDISDPYFSVLNCVLMYYANRNVNKINDFKNMANKLSETNMLNLDLQLDNIGKYHACYMGGYMDYANSIKKHEMRNNTDDFSLLSVNLYNCDDYVTALKLCLSNGVPTYFNEDGQNFLIVNGRSGLINKMNTKTVNYYSERYVKSDTSKFKDDETINNRTMLDIAPNLRHMLKSKNSLRAALGDVCAIFKINEMNIGVKYNPGMYEKGMMYSEYRKIFMGSDNEDNFGDNKVITDFTNKNLDIEKTKVNNESDIPSFLQTVDDGAASWNNISNLYCTCQKWWLLKHIPHVHIKEHMSNINTSKLKSILFNRLFGEKWGMFVDNNMNKDLYVSYMRSGEKAGREIGYTGSVPPSDFYFLQELLKA